MQRQTDLRRLVGEALARRLHAAHHELEVRVVVALLRADHQEFALAVGAAVQAMRAVEHENLERRNAMPADELWNLADMSSIHGREVVAVVDMEAPRRDLEHFGKEVRI